MDIKKAVEKLIQKHHTSDPFALATILDVIIIYSDMKNTLGFFNKYKRIKMIHLNNYIPEDLKNFVCAHELGHAIFHPNVNTPFLKRHTFYSANKIETEANTFAVELLLPDDLLREFETCSLFSIASKRGIPKELINLKQKE